MEASKEESLVSHRGWNGHIQMFLFSAVVGAFVVLMMRTIELQSQVATLKDSVDRVNSAVSKLSSHISNDRREETIADDDVDEEVEDDDTEETEEERSGVPENGDETKKETEEEEEEGPPPS